MRYLFVALSFCGLTTVASAQTPMPAQLACEPDPIPPSDTTVIAGQSFPVIWCHEGKNEIGAIITTPLTFEVFRNNTLLSGVTVTKGPTNAAGTTAYYFRRTEAVAGQVTFEVAAVAGGRSARVPLSVTVEAAPTPPPLPPQRPRVYR